MNEQWRDVVGYEGFYRVSDLGRVMGLARKDAAGNRIRGRMLRLSPVTGGYLAVNLCRDGEARKYRAHVLVLTSFIGPRPNGMDACHYDGDCTNNRLANLRWDTRSANAKDRIRLGRIVRGEQFKRGLTEQLVFRAVEMRRSGMNLDEIAAEVGVTKSAVSLVLCGKSWKHLKLDLSLGANWRLTRDRRRLGRAAA